MHNNNVQRCCFCVMPRGAQADRYFFVAGINDDTAVRAQQVKVYYYEHDGAGLNFSSTNLWGDKGLKVVLAWWCACPCFGLSKDPPA